MTFLRSVLMIALLAALLAAPAQAADPVYPAGSRIGLVPPPGMTNSQAFTGFEDRDNRVALVVVALPAAAFADIEKSTTPETLQKQGLTLESREDVTHPLGKGMLVHGSQQIEDVKIRKWIFVVPAGDLTALVTMQVPEAAQAIYPEAAIRATLMSVSVRPNVPVDEQLTLLPFRVSELAGFRIGGIVAGRAVMLTDGPPEKPAAIDTHILVALAPGAPAQAADRGRFAQEVFGSLPNIKDIRINSAETLRIGGQQGHQIMARGKDGTTGEDVTIVQWLRFGGTAYLHMVGVAKSDAWTPAYARFRQVRDGIDLH
ncbi:MAG TPA: hypothetical protein VFB68_20340 [Xanthobacteraceae bacterium]|nr:hypothetical protein [Xanthobacteraceae bacterium]